MKSAAQVVSRLRDCPGAGRLGMQLRQARDVRRCREPLRTSDGKPRGEASGRNLRPARAARRADAPADGADRSALQIPHRRFKIKPARSTSAKLRSRREVPYGSRLRNRAGMSVSERRFGRSRIAVGTPAIRCRWRREPQPEGLPWSRTGADRSARESAPRSPRCGAPSSLRPRLMAAHDGDRHHRNPGLHGQLERSLS